MKKTKKDIYEKEILKVIEDNNLFVITDIFAFYTKIKRAQFYVLQLDKSDNIKEAIDSNKVKSCQSLKNDWLKSDNPTLQIAVFKTICTEEDAHRLNGSKTENKNENTNTTTVINLGVGENPNETTKETK